MAHRLNRRYLATLYDHVDGTTHDWGAYDSRTDRFEVLDRLVAIHEATATVRGIALVDDFVIPSRHKLLDALADSGSLWGPGPFAPGAEQLLRYHGPAVTDTLERYDNLVCKVAEMRERFVITHGEPHRGITINTTEGVALIDWDTVLLAQPERDLWMLTNEEPSIADDYAVRTGVAVDTASVELYRLWWDLCEVSLYIAEFRAHHTDTEDTRTAWNGLREHLDSKRWKPES